jgi:hypothetical protein
MSDAIIVIQNYIIISKESASELSNGNCDYPAVFNLAQK